MAVSDPGLLGRDDDLPEPESDGILRCNPVAPYGSDLNRETCELLHPVWPVGEDLCSVQGVLVTNEELHRLYLLPPEAFSRP